MGLTTVCGEMEQVNVVASLAMHNMEVILVSVAQILYATRARGTAMWTMSAMGT